MCDEMHTLNVFSTGDFNKVPINHRNKKTAKIGYYAQKLSNLV